MKLNNQEKDALVWEIQKELRKINEKQLSHLRKTKSVISEGKRIHRLFSTISDPLKKELGCDHTLTSIIGEVAEVVNKKNPVISDYSHNEIKNRMILYLAGEGSRKFFTIAGLKGEIVTSYRVGPITKKK